MERSDQMNKLLNEKQSFWPAACVGAFLCFTLLFLGPMDMYLANIGDLWFGIGEFWWRLGLTAMVVWAVCAGVFLLLRKLHGKLYLHAVALLFGLGLAVYVQGNFLSIGAAALEGATPVWTAHMRPMILNLAIWLALIFAPLVLSELIPKIMHKAAGYLSLALIAMQVVALVVSLISVPLDKENGSLYLAKEGQFEMSSDENIIVLIVDAFGIDYFSEIEKKNPETLDFLDGFTYYPNNVGTFRRTIPVFAYLMTGEFYLNQAPFLDFFKEAVEKDTFWYEMMDLGYEIRVSEKMGMVYEPKQMEYIENLVASDQTVSSHAALVKSMLRMTGYRFLPNIMSPFLLTDFAGQFDALSMTPVDAPEPYLKDDAVFYQDLTENMRMEKGMEQKAFHLYFLRGAHVPYTLNENAQRVTEEETDLYRQSIGVMKILDEYISQLKALDLYDDSTIIIMADHSHEIDNVYGSPIFMMKPRGSRGEFTSSSAPISQTDFRATLMQAAGGDYEKYGTPVDQWKEGDERIRTYYRGTVMNFTEEYHREIYEWIVDGDARNLDNFSKTGKVYTREGVKEDG